MRKLVLTAMVLALFACGKAPEAPAPAEPVASAPKAEAVAKAPAPAAEPAKAPEAPAGLAIAKLNLKIDAPADSTVTDMMGSQMVQGPGWVVMIKEAGENDAKTLEAAKKEAEMYTPKNGKDETLADGWLYTFDNTGDAGANFFLNMFRTINGKGYRCDTTASSDEQRAASIAACKSLKP